MDGLIKHQCDVKVSHKIATQPGGGGGISPIVPGGTLMRTRFCHLCLLMSFVVSH